MINFILIALFLGLGALFKRKNWLPQSASHRLNQFVIFICLPSIVLVKIPELTFDSQLLLPTLLPWAMIVVSSGLVIIFSRMQNYSRPVTGCLLLVCCFGNTSFFGFPMVNAFYGERGLPYAVVYDLLGSFLSLAIIGNLILAIYSEGELFSVKKTLYRVLTFPPFIALVIAWLFKDWTYPQWLTQCLQAIGFLLVPSTMFLVGMHLSFKVDEQSKKPLKFVLLSKLVLVPICALVLIKLFVSGQAEIQLASQVSLFESAMPPMVTASVLAIHAKLAPKIAAAAVGIGLFCSCITLPLWYLISSMI